MLSAASLRAPGVVGELTSLVATKRVRGRFDMGACDTLILQAARAEGLTHLVVNAVIPWGNLQAVSSIRVSGVRAAAT